MTEKEKAEIIEVVHSTLRGFFEPFFGEERPFTQTENVLLEVNKAICNKIREMPVDRPHGEWIECEEMNCHSDIEKIYICPFCKMKHHRKYDFCNCGADMREGDRNEIQSY